MFGLELDQIKNLGAEYTATEIRQQPRLWKETFSIVEAMKGEIEKFLNKVVTKDIRIVLTGAGTSDYVGDTVVLSLAKKLGVRVEAIATTDLVSNPHEYVEEDTKTLLVSYARSGNSPESVGAFDIFQNNVKDIYQLVITCNEDGALSKKSKELDNSLVILMPKESNDKSFAMTSSFSCMTMATLLAFDIKNLELNNKIVDVICEQAENILENQWSDVKELVEYGCGRVVYLGSGALKGLVQEMALKNLELTSGKTVTVCESVLGFRHGPKSIIDDNTLIIFMNSTNEYSNLYDMDLIKEINGDSGNHKLAVISYNNKEEIENVCTKYITVNGKEVPEIFTIFNYMLYGQMFGLFSSLKLGISPDNPRPDGTVNRVVKGVIIHEYK